MKKMYPAMVNSPEAVTRGALTASGTQVEISDGGIFAGIAVPFPLTLGEGESAETVLLTARNGNMLTLQRAFQGAARSWDAGTKVARYFTAYDADAFKENIEALANGLEAVIDDCVDNLSAAKTFAEAKAAEVLSASMGYTNTQASAAANAAADAVLAVWTPAKAGFVDAATSSRAPASTALSTAQWTNAKAGYIDAAITGRAPASTALSNAQWTNARAAALDTIGAANPTASNQATIMNFLKQISDKVDALGAAGSGGGIKAVQRGIISNQPNTVTNVELSPINPVKTFVLIDNLFTAGDNTSRNIYITEVNETRFSVRRIGSEVVNMSWQVIEFN
jgi:hypothetical protein